MITYSLVITLSALNNHSQARVQGPWTANVKSGRKTARSRQAGQQKIALTPRAQRDPGVSFADAESYIFEEHVSIFF